MQGADRIAAKSSPEAPVRLAPLTAKSILAGGHDLEKRTHAVSEPRLGFDFVAIRISSPPRRDPPAASVPGTQTRHPLFTAFPSPAAPILQRFTASLGAANKVLIHPEKGDTSADLNKALCPVIKNRDLGKRKEIDVTQCLPKSIAKAMELGPYNCSDFVRSSLGDVPPAESTNLDRMMTPKLWEELLKKRAYTLRGLAVVDEEGRVKPAEGLSWKQRDPRMGDIAFMRGGVYLNKGEKEPAAKGDNFRVSWDHVGIFIIRSRNGLDYHLAKDGDENPIGVYHTGSGEEEGLGGAYVKGTGTLAAYLAPPEEPKGAVDKK